MKDVTLYQRKLQREYSRTRELLIRNFKRQQTHDNAKALIKTATAALTARQSRIIGYYISKSFLNGVRDAKKEVKDIKIVRGAASPSKAEIGFDLNTITDSNLQKIGRANIGAIGKFNIILRDDLIKQYDELLSDNKLLTSLNKDGWTPWLGESLKKRGIDPAVISLVKHQKTTVKMLTIINEQGIRGGMHPDQVARRLVPYINRYFGPDGVTIDNVGKKVRRFTIDANGNYKWVEHTVTRKYHATARNYSRLIARNSMKEARREAYYRSLKKTNLVDHYISVSVMDARTCGSCAMMHGQRVTHADGPSYHGNCHCDLKPVWRRNSVLADKNKSDKHYERQRDIHFMRLNDLKAFNLKMPSGSKLKNYALLPDNAITKIMPGPMHMRKIRHALMGEPNKIIMSTPVEKAKHGLTPLTDDELRGQADILWDKTEKDHVEHMRVFTGYGDNVDFTGSAHAVPWRQPLGKFNTMHTHPSDWDPPLSGADIHNFLTNSEELQGSATSKNWIYILTKQKGYKVPPIDALIFQKQFKKDATAAFVKTIKGGNREVKYRNAYLEVGKNYAKKYGVEYRAIQRKP